MVLYITKSIRGKEVVTILGIHGCVEYLAFNCVKT